MAIPDFQTMMGPTLRLLADGKSRKCGDVVEHLASFFKLSPGDVVERTPSGRQTKLYNRAA